MTQLYQQPRINGSIQPNQEPVTDTDMSLNGTTKYHHETEVSRIADPAPANRLSSGVPDAVPETRLSARPTAGEYGNTPERRPFRLPGSGIVQGMMVTARNWFGSYFDRKRLVTVQYPEQQIRPPENSRSIPFLVYDGDDPDAGLRCVACHTCEKECPPQAISIVGERDENGKPARRPKVFDIDISVCMGCQICAEVCPFDAIKMDHYLDHSSLENFQSLILGKTRLSKSNAYFHTINSTDATAVDARLEADRKKKEAARQKRAAAK